MLGSIPSWDQRSAFPMQQHVHYPSSSKFTIPQKAAGGSMPHPTRMFSKPRDLTAFRLPAVSKNLSGGDFQGDLGKESPIRGVSPSSSQLETGLWSPKPAKKGPAKRLLLSNISSSREAPPQSSFYTPAGQSINGEHSREMSWQKVASEAGSPTVSLGGSESPKRKPEATPQKSVSRKRSVSAHGSVNRGSLDIEAPPNHILTAEASKNSNLAVDADDSQHAAPGQESPEQFKSIFDFL